MELSQQVILRLGNYIGAIKNFVKLQDEYESYYFVADLHSLTMGDNNADELEKRRKEIVATYLACGLDPNKCTIFYQSDIYEHTLVQWLLTCESTMGELSRMTQYKDKSQVALKQANGTEKIPVGLFMYPYLNGFWYFNLWCWLCAYRRRSSSALRIN